jgi:hypothetical protein
MLWDIDEHLHSRCYRWQFDSYPNALFWRPFWMHVTTSNNWISVHFERLRWMVCKKFWKIVACVCISLAVFIIFHWQLFLLFQLRSIWSGSSGNFKTIASESETKTNKHSLDVEVEIQDAVRQQEEDQQLEEEQEEDLPIFCNFTRMIVQDCK